MSDTLPPAAPTELPPSGQVGKKKSPFAFLDALGKLKLPSLSLGGGGGKKTIGLSIGSSSIKLVELQRAGKVWRLVHFGMVQLPEDAIMNREIINTIAVIDGIRTLVTQLRLSNRQVCTSVSGNSVIIKRMTVEAPNVRELRDQVFWEAEQYLPFDVSEVVMDFQSLAKLKDKQFDILFVACKRSLIEAYQGAIEEAGLKPNLIDVDFFALQNVFEANYPSNPAESVCLVDIGASATKIAVVHSGVPVFTKEGGIGGSALTAEIQKQLNLSYADAESLKVGASGGGSLPQEVSDLAHSFAENIANEIKRNLEFFSASSTAAPVGSILLCGGGAKTPGLSQVIEESTGFPTQIMNPFNAITYDPSVFTPEYAAAIGPLAAVPIGLAMRAGA